MTRSRLLALILATSSLAPSAQADPAPLASKVARLPTTGPLPPLAPVLLSDPYDAAQLGIDWLMAELCTWSQTTAINVDCTDNTRKSCFGCHVQAEPVLGLARSVTRCYRLNDTPCSVPGDSSPIEYAARFVAGCQRKACILGTPVCGFGSDTTTLDRQAPELGSIGHYPDCGSNAGPASVHPVIQSAHGGLNLAGFTRYIAPTYSGNVVALANWWVRRQEASGAWTPDRNEAPVDQGAVFVASSAVMAIQVARPFGSAAEQASYDAAIARVLAWLPSQVLTTMQDRTFALLLALEAGLPRTDPQVQALVAALLAEQNADGGWSERAGLASNAYATGQAMNALIEAGVPLDDIQVCRGIAWLVVAQNLDGSWDIGTAGVSTDSTRNSQFTATIWPVLALGSLSPWGARLSAPSDAVETCAPAHSWDVTVTHQADTACGLFSRPDTFDAWVTNDRGDIVSVTPATFDLASGGTFVVRVDWSRVGPLPGPGVASTTTLHVASRGAAATGCPIDTTATLSVTIPPDVRPPALGPSLRLAKVEPDAKLTWDPLPQELSGYDVVSVECAMRGGCLELPTKAVLDARSPVATAPADTAGVVLPGLGSSGGPELVFVKVRAVSACYFTAGPTCDRTCTDPARCDWFCP